MPDPSDKPAVPPGSQSASGLPIQRKLATILSADVAEFSRLMSEDEEQTLRTFRGHKKIFEALVANHNGRVFNTAGDAILAEFSSAVEAVRCATDVQAALRTRNDKFPPNRQVRFRIGVNLGDVMIQGEDLLGDGVNLAARLQTAAEPGGVCISGSVHDQIRNKLSLTFQSLGERNYKNIPQPVRTFAIAESEAGAVLPAPKPARPTKRGAAVWALAGVLIAAGIGYGAYALYQHGKLTSAPAATAENTRVPAPPPDPAAAPAVASTQAPSPSATQPAAAVLAPPAKPEAPAAHKDAASAPPVKKTSAPASKPKAAVESEETVALQAQATVTSAPAPSESAAATPAPSNPAPVKPASSAIASRPATNFVPPPSEPAAAEPRSHAGPRAGGAARAGEYDGTYSGDLCYGKAGGLPNHCYVASGTVTGNRISGTWVIDKGPLKMFLEGHVGPKGRVTIEMHSDEPNGTRVATINMTGTIRNGTILTDGKFLRGRPANLDWHLQR